MSNKEKSVTIVASNDVSERDVHLHPDWEQEASLIAHRMNQAAEAAEMPYVLDSMPKSATGRYFSPDQGAIAVKNACIKLFGSPPVARPMGRKLPGLRAVDMQKFRYLGLDMREINESELENPLTWTTKMIQEYLEKNVPSWVAPRYDADVNRDYRSEFLAEMRKTLIVTGTYTVTEQVPFELLQYPGKDDIEILALAQDGEQYQHMGEVFQLAVKAKVKDRKLVDVFYKAVIDELENANLYRGRCFEYSEGGKVSYLNPFEGMDPRNLVFSTRVNKQVERQILSVIRYREKAKALNPALLGTKALFSGKPGTGKSEAMKMIQQEALQNGWTAASLKCGTSDHDRDAFFQFISSLGPVVIIREDIETDEPSREGSAKQIAEARSRQLSISDGIMNKGNDWLLIASTNDEEALSTASIRPGRMDVYVKFESPDREAFKKLMQMQVGDLLPADVDLDALWGPEDEKPETTIRQLSVEGLAGIPAPFLTNGLIETVQRFSLEYDLGESITSEDMYWVLDSVSNHAGLYDRIDAKENAGIVDPLEAATIRVIQKAQSMEYAKN